jgi:HK97 family phage portal protein
VNWLQKLFTPRLSTKAFTPILYGSGSVVTNISDNPQNYLRQYSYNDIVYSLINLITDRVNSVKWGVYRETKNGLKPFEDENLQKLLDEPNPYNTFSDIVAHHTGFKLITGNSYLWAQRLIGGANEGIPAELWHLPADLVDLVVSRGFPPKVVQYQIPGWQAKFTPDEILHSKEWNPNYDTTGSQLYGISKLKAALNLVNRNNSAMNAATAKFQNGGLETVLFVDDERFTGDQTQSQALALKEKLREYDAEGRRIAVSGYKTGALQLGLTNVELAIIEAEQWDLRRLCNIYGVPVQLMNDTSASTDNNMKDASRAMLTRVVIPELEAFKTSFNKKLQTVWGGKDGVIIDYDQTSFSELEEDKNEQMKWLLPLMQNGLPLNRVLDILGLEKIDDPYYDLPRVTTQMGDTIEERQQTEVDALLSQNQIPGVTAGQTNARMNGKQ